MNRQRSGRGLARKIVVTILLTAAMAVNALAAGYAELTDMKYDDLGAFSEGMIAVCVGDKWGYADEHGAEVVPPRYDAAFAFSDGLAAVVSDDMFGFIDTAGKEIVPFQYDYLTYLADGIAAAATGEADDEGNFQGKWGLIIRPLAKL